MLRRQRMNAQQHRAAHQHLIVKFRVDLKSHVPEHHPEGEARNGPIAGSSALLPPKVIPEETPDTEPVPPTTSGTPDS